MQWNRDEGTLVDVKDLYLKQIMLNAALSNILKF